MSAATLRTDLPRCAKRSGPYERSTHATRTGDNTPRIMHTTGALSHTGTGDQEPSSRPKNKATGKAKGFASWGSKQMESRLQRLDRIVADTHLANVGLRLVLTSFASGPSRTSTGPYLAHQRRRSSPLDKPSDPLSSRSATTPASASRAGNTFT